MQKQYAIVLVWDDREQLLFLRRSASDPWKPGYWNFPGGGVEPYEAPLRGARRELREEADIDLPLSRFSYLTTYWRLRHEGPTHVFMTRLSAPRAVRFPDGEHDNYIWAPPRQAPQPVIPTVSEILRRL